MPPMPPMPTSSTCIDIDSAPLTCYLSGDRRQTMKAPKARPARGDVVTLTGPEWPLTEKEGTENDDE